MFKPKTKHPLKKSEVKCQNCKAKFIIEPEDFEFYKKIDVPEPTFCPECRLVRRMASWNERVLYRRKCDLCKESMVSLYSPDKPFKVYCNKCWWSDKWDPLDYGRDYDFNRSFFEQFYELQKEVPIINLLNKKSVNSEYCHDALEMKDCYMMFLTGMCRDSAYGTFAMVNKDCIDNYKVLESELCYSAIDCSKCYKLFFSEDCTDCYSSTFLFNCHNCSDCFGCVNLRSKKYHIFNKAYSKEEYHQEIKKYDLGSHAVLLEIEKEFNQFSLKFPRKFARIVKSVNVSGDEIRGSKNCFKCFKVDRDTENSKYLSVGGFSTKDCYDIYNTGLNITFSYESVCLVDNCYQSFFTTGVWTGRNIEYSDYCHNVADLFGCVSLHNKKYCIFNKQYSEEEYKKLVAKIKVQMNEMPYKDKKGRIYKYGEYFPMELARFGYNESVAQMYFPFKKEEAITKGYPWHNKDKNEYQPTIKAEDLPDHINEVDESILKEIVKCGYDSSDCAGPGVFRIVSMEYEFYKKMGLSLPRVCPDCRHRDMFRKRTLFKLYHRQCMKQGCSTEFETSYSPDRKEIVYCEECYLKEVG